MLDNSDYKLLYDFNIFTDHKITAWRPDLVLMDKQLQCTKLIDVAYVMDRHVVEKHREKIEKYLVLAVELQTRAEVIMLMILCIILFRISLKKACIMLQTSCIILEIILIIVM